LKGEAGCPSGVFGPDPVALPVEEVGEAGYALGDWLSSLTIRICSSRCLFLDAVSDRARSRAGGGFCSIPATLDSLSTDGASVDWSCGDGICGVVICGVGICEPI
jgi:hypothetical protein